MNAGAATAEPAWRLLVDPPADGAWNMAVDEAILQSYVSGRPPEAPTLRLYAWDPPALSLGRFQPAAGSHDAAFLRDQAIDLVRRPTGGRAVLHEHERTYSVCGHLRRAPFGGGVMENYRAIAAALAGALRALEVVVEIREAATPACGSDEAACFAAVSAHEIALAGRKLVGSAQMRRRGAFLQHGSILLRCEGRRLARALGRPDAAVRMSGLLDAMGDDVGAERLDASLIESFERSFAVALRSGSLSDRERERATRLRSGKYLSARWTLDGRHDGAAAARQADGRTGPAGRADRAGP